MAHCESEAAHTEAFYCESEAKPIEAVYHESEATSAEATYCESEAETGAEASMTAAVTSASDARAVMCDGVLEAAVPDDAIRSKGF